VGDWFAYAALLKSSWKPGDDERGRLEDFELGRQEAEEAERKSRTGDPHPLHPGDLDYVEWWLPPADEEEDGRMAKMDSDGNDGGGW
jgi:hypothetical protein